ncbi:MAG: TrmH family RNA methyltransferase, partial [Clostridia bacterium]
IYYYDSFQELVNKYSDKKFYFLSKKGAKCYSDVAYSEDCFLVFGKETKGLPEELLRANYEDTLRLPMVEGQRCLNLSNTVAIVAYEALRQLKFKGLQLEGHLKEE